MSEAKNLVLNWEKCHFIVTRGIVSGHIVSEKGIEVDKAKVDLIANLLTPTCVKDIRSFKDMPVSTGNSSRISMQSQGLCAIFFSKDSPFEWTLACEKAFTKLKAGLVSPSIVQSQNWNLPFELMCDANDYAVVQFCVNVKAMNHVCSTMRARH